MIHNLLLYEVQDLILGSVDNVRRSVITLKFVFFFFLVFSRAAPTAYGGSQAGGLIGAAATGLTPQPQQRRIRAASVTYTTAHGNTGYLTHRASPGIEPKTSWFLVGFINH